MSWSYRAMYRVSSAGTLSRQIMQVLVCLLIVVVIGVSFCLLLNLDSELNR